MTETTSEAPDTGPPSMAAVAAEPVEESVAAEVEAVGDQPDVGGLVDEDRAQ